MWKKRKKDGALGATIIFKLLIWFWEEKKFILIFWNWRKYFLLVLSLSIGIGENYLYRFYPYLLELEEITFYSFYPYLLELEKMPRH